MTTTKDIIKNTFVFGGPVLICMGIVKLFFYYSFFNIEITRFVTISEVLTYFTGDIVFYLSLGVFTFIITYLTNNSHVIKYRRNFITFCKTDDPLIRLLKFAYTSRFYVSLVLGLIFYFISAYNKSYLSEVFGYFLLINIIYFLISLSIQEIKRKDRNQKRLKKDNLIYEIYSYLLLRVLFLIFIYTLIEVQRVKHESRYVNTQITLDDNSIISDSTNFYIGNTNNYVFVFNKTQDRTSVFPMTRVRQIDFGDIYYFPKVKNAH